MTRREKIILGLTAVALAGAVFYYSGLVGGVSPDGGEALPAPSARTDLDEIRSRFALLSLNTWEESVLGTRDETWGGDPFVSQLTMDAPGDALSEDSLTYTGFMKIGDSRIGIINDVEYTPGMWLENGQFRILSLAPGEARLGRPGSPVEIRLEMEREN